MKKLLFVDNNPLDQFILKKILTQYKLNYEVNCTASGEEVISFLKQNKSAKDNLPDIILLDIHMPNFDGWALLEKLKTLHRTLAKPFGVYILTASINPEDIRRSQQYHFVKSFIFKPITREALEKLISSEIGSTE